MIEEPLSAALEDGNGGPIVPPSLPSHLPSYAYTTVVNIIINIKFIIIE